MNPSEQNANDWSACDPEYFPELMQKSYLKIYRNNACIVEEKGSMVTWSHKVIVGIIVLILVGSVVLSVAQFFPG